MKDLKCLPATTTSLPEQPSWASGSRVTSSQPLSSEGNGHDAGTEAGQEFRSELNSAPENLKSREAICFLPKMLAGSSSLRVLMMFCTMCI